MISENIRDFLSKFLREDLEKKKILINGGGSGPYQLRQGSVKNLIDLMISNGIDKLYGPENWYITKECDFYNKRSKRKNEQSQNIITGNLKELKKKRD